MQYAGNRFHGRMNRAGGLAEFPNVTLDFIVDPKAEMRRVVIEIATSPSEAGVVKRIEESYVGSLTSFLISPDPKRDADQLECASEMSERRLAWAREASGGKRISPTNHIVQTSFWSPQRPELNLKEAEVLWLLGFNVVGNQRKEVRGRFDFKPPGHTHGVKIGPAATRQEIDDLMAKHAKRAKHVPAPGVPFGLSDEVVCRPRIGKDEKALKHFHEWLSNHKLAPSDLGVTRLNEVVPIEFPDQLRERQKVNDVAARRVFYYTSRFRQAALTTRLKWHTELFHKHFGDGPLTSTLMADHPYFAGTGMGMGMKPDAAWGNFALAGDWFDIGRTKAVDLIGIEDWMGLQYMYGPNYTWEGFQLMGFQASIFRSVSRGGLPIIAWITPSDETNLRLKTASALCQGAKHFFYWTYGPTCTSTENYWSDLRSAYDGVVDSTRNLAAAEHIIAPGRPRKTRVAVLYSISSDLWQPFGYVHMLERRVTYLALIHSQYLVDFLSEEDIEAGRLSDYDCLYVTDPCIKPTAVARITQWVRLGGHLYGSCGAGSHNAFGEPAAGLSPVFGIESGVKATVQPGRYHVRGALNGMQYLDEVRGDLSDLGQFSFGVIGARMSLELVGAKTLGTFKDGTPAVVGSTFGKGRTLYVGACPAIAYAKEAKFVPRELKEKWPMGLRDFICGMVRERGVSRLAELSHPVVETGIYDSDAGTALVLANFTYEPIDALKVTISLPKRCQSVRSVVRGPLTFTRCELTPAARGGHTQGVRFSLPLGLNDIVLCE